MSGSNFCLGEGSEAVAFCMIRLALFIAALRCRILGQGVFADISHQTPELPGELALLPAQLSMSPSLGRYLTKDKVISRPAS